MATEDKPCRNGHPLDQRYRGPGGRLRCRGCEHARQHKYAAAHPDRIKASSQRYWTQNREALRLKSRMEYPKWSVVGARRRATIRQAVLTKLGSKCVRCGFYDERALQIDHINGGGNKEKDMGAAKMYRKILADSTGYQLLCANCNAIKKVENKEVVGRRYLAAAS